MSETWYKVYIYCDKKHVVCWYTVLIYIYI